MDTPKAKIKEGHVTKTVEYETSDFYFVAYLKAMGLNISRVKKAGHNRNGGTQRFIFIMRGDIPAESENLSDLYYTGKAMVNPVDYKGALQFLKNYIHDGDKDKEGSKDE